MEEQNKIAQDEKVSNEAVKRDAKTLWYSVRTFLSELLDIRSDTDRDSTIEAVKRSCQKGYFI